MDPASGSSLSQRSDQINLEQSTPTFFPKAHNFIITDSTFNAFGGGVNHGTEMSIIDVHLKPHISEAAMHDSLVRCPPALCHPKTREKVRDVISDWIKDLYPLQRIMWLYGPAGAGKSAIAQTIAEDFRDSRLAASFFFLRGTSDRGVANRLFLTIAWQLSTSIPETLPYIESALKKERIIHSKSIDIQFDRLIVTVLENLLSDKPDLRPEKYLVIIDGVDECASEEEQEHFLTLIANALARTPLRFLICSRPEPRIKRTFDTENIQRLTRTVVLDEKFSPDDDIRRYLVDEFFRIFNKHKISPPPSPENIEHLLSKASGQFIYASTVIKFIDNVDCDPKEQLNIILKLNRGTSSSPYAQLDQLYMQILLSQRLDVRSLRNVFVLIVARGEPSLKFVCRRLRISEDNLQRKLCRMHSLLDISGSSIKAYHRSLHDFLLDKNRAGKYHIHPLRVALVRLPDRTRRFAEGLVRLAFLIGRDHLFTSGPNSKSMGQFAHGGAHGVSGFTVHLLLLDPGF